MTTLAFYQKLAGQKRITTRAAAQLAGLSIPAASMALRRLAVDGLSTRLKKGAWLIGTSSPKPGALVTAAADPYLAYLSGWSAQRLHDRIQQIPQTQFAVTLGRPGEVEKCPMAGSPCIASNRSFSVATFTIPAWMDLSRRLERHCSIWPISRP
jgi:predicted transcriptional regulator of viral defense system